MDKRNRALKKKKVDLKIKNGINISLTGKKGLYFFLVKLEVFFTTREPICSVYAQRLSIHWAPETRGVFYSGNPLLSTPAYSNHSFSKKSYLEADLPVDFGHHVKY